MTTPMMVYIVSLEWNEPSSEVCGDTGIVGVYATQAAADAAGVAERQERDADGDVVFNHSHVEGAFCGLCGEPAPRDAAGRPTDCTRPHEPNDEVQWCDHCGAELTDSGDCSEDHDAWDVDVHVTAHQVQGVAGA